MKKTICVLVGIVCCGIFSSGFNSYVWDALRQQLDAYGRFVQIRFADGTFMTSATDGGGPYMLLEDYDNDPENGIIDTTEKLAGNVFTPSTPTSVTWRAQQGFYIDAGYGTTSPQYTYISDGVVADMSPSALLMPYAFTDLYGLMQQAYDPFVGNAILSGSMNSPLAAKTGGNHPGVGMITSNASNADSGYRLMGTNIVGTTLSGGEVFDVILNLDVATNATIYAGFHDATTSDLPADGVYFAIEDDTVLRGSCSAASVRSSTATTYTLSIDTWYRLRLVVNTAMSRADFYLYAENGTLLWTNYITSNIPTGQLAVGICPTYGLAVATNIVHLDFMGVGNLKPLVR